MLSINTTSIKASIEWQIQKIEKIEGTKQPIQQLMPKFDGIFDQLTQQSQLMNNKRLMFGMPPTARPSPTRKPSTLPNHPTPCLALQMPLPAKCGPHGFLWHQTQIHFPNTWSWWQQPSRPKQNTHSKPQAVSTASLDPFPLLSIPDISHSQHAQPTPPIQQFYVQVSLTGQKCNKPLFPSLKVHLIYTPVLAWYKVANSKDSNISNELCIYFLTTARQMI